MKVVTDWDRVDSRPTIHWSDDLLPLKELERTQAGRLALEIPVTARNIRMIGALRRKYNAVGWMIRAPLNVSSNVFLVYRVRRVEHGNATGVVGTR